VKPDVQQVTEVETMAIPSPIYPTVETTPPGKEKLGNFVEYDSYGACIRKERGGATLALFETLQFVSRDFYPTEDIWLKDSRIGWKIKCDGLRISMRPPPLTAAEVNDFLKITLYKAYNWSMYAVSYRK
jgi:hypothetical protein